MALARGAGSAEKTKEDGLLVPQRVHTPTSEEGGTSTRTLAGVPLRRARYVARSGDDRRKLECVVTTSSRGTPQERNKP